MLGSPSIDSFPIHQGRNRQLQFVGDLKILNLIHGITLNGKHGCIRCMWNPRELTRKNQLTFGANPVPSRSFIE